MGLLELGAWILEQAERLSGNDEVSNVVLVFSVRTAATHTPQFLGMPQGAWSQNGGFDIAGEGVVIGFVDIGIDPSHPSIGDNKSQHPYPVPAHFSGICEVTRDFPSGSCNRKLVGARHFTASAITRGNTPKYGLIFHSSFIGRASAKNKGRMARYLANKCSIASRIDCFSEKGTSAFSEKLREQVEERLDF
ncbi:subtilisin-like protease SBT2.3 [Lathyrus oleraceus]|uniref:subtilisin-like protease SBT2.3 n=1 Tax=Pisum sativum TaxID=3888 RepID=UPI0021CF2656|nr:subtilisin-like protease SBT2.3 [Pisum sativum]